jgi:cytochrome c peroxidase
MMYRKLFFLTAIAGSLILLSYLIGACSKSTHEGFGTYMPQEVPAGFPKPVYTFADNPLNQEGFELGRKLFYDGRLSLDGNFPCASCHEQRGAFGTFEHDRSHGYNNSHTLRNAPPLFNLAWEKEFHWDGEYKTLLQEASHPFNTFDEMGADVAGAVSRLEKDEEIKKMFEGAFGSSWITEDRIIKALSQFTGNIVSYNSRYDKVKRGELSFTAQEQSGYTVFQSKCVGCHTEPMFTDYSYRNIGLPIDPTLNDLGRIRVTGKADDNLKFRVPSLRNVELTSNYMHDGRFGTVAQVINHYRTGMQNSATVDPLIQGGINMTNTEAIDLSVFLKTLSDSSILTNLRYKQ